MSAERPSFEYERSPEEIERIATRALQSAFTRYTELGERGLEEVQKNQFNETALRMDVEAEAAVLESLRQDNFPVRVYSEEHGIVDIGKPEFLAVLDGIDGTALYKTDRTHGRYGTMLCIFQGVDPRYQDYITGGIMQHATGRSLIGLKEKGAFAISDLEKKQIHTSGNTDFDTSTKIYIDEFFEINRTTFSERLQGYNTEYRKASSLYYAAVAEGLADFALECTRKGNLEIAAAYPLIREAGGAMVDLHGNDIGQQKYLEFGMKKDEYIPIITAASHKLAEKLRAFLEKTST